MQAKNQVSHQKRLLQKQVAIGRIDKLNKSIHFLINSYKLEINQLDDRKQANYKDPLRQITIFFEDLLSSRRARLTEPTFSDRSQVVSTWQNIQEQKLL